MRESIDILLRLYLPKAMFFQCLTIALDIFAVQIQIRYIHRRRYTRNSSDFDKSGVETESVNDSLCVEPYI